MLSFPLRAVPCFLVVFLMIGPTTTVAGGFQNQEASVESRPNVIVIMTDDQGIGDFGCMGNPLVKTPNVDRMFERSARFSNFYVCPVCSPTRASLMTGRYNYRTRVVDTYIGRSMMESAEVTIAERFKRANYATGIFGKWHLGDCYPMRPHDQGFDRAVVHRGGGIGQGSDPVEAEGAYTNPILQHNGVDVQEEGYCTDVYYDHALDFIEENAKDDKPFFVYLPDNCPHGPFRDLPQDWWAKYKDQDLSNAKFPVVEGGFPLGQGNSSDQTNRVFAMISNIDENIGRVQKKLTDLGIVENTIVIFMTDNGPNGDRYTCGLRGRKTSVYEGGIRTLFLMQWPKRIKDKSTTSNIAAHIDLAPTLVDACSLPQLDDDPEMDGVSLMPLINGSSLGWKPRHLFFQVHRGNTPQKYHHFAVRDDQFKLVHHSGFGNEEFKGEPKFELFDLKNDPYERTDLAAEQPQRVSELKAAYEEWFDHVGQTRPDNYSAPRIVVSAADENPLLLSRQDARRKPDAERGNWATTIRWLLTSQDPQVATATIYFKKPVSGTVKLFVGDREYRMVIDQAKQCQTRVDLPASNFDVRGHLVPLSVAEKVAKPIGVHQVEFEFK